MKMSIKKLDPEVVSKIRSSFTVNSVAQCVFELVTNSLDAKSTSIAIRINLLTYKIQVADNGEGINKENMRLLGLRHTTNKCRKYKDLEHLKTYGYRGEALASIMEMCQKITITSRCKESNDTYFKDLSKVLKGKVKLGKSRASIGTTVTVLGWFNTVPVRQQRIVEEIELEEVKKQLEALIIINPQASFSLRNDVTGLLILNIPKTPDIVDTFRHLHPEFSEAFTLLKVAKSKVTVRLLIQKELFPTKNFQYIYVNKRPVESTKIKQHVYKTSCSSNKRKNKQSLLFNKQKHHVYVMNIKCPQKCLNLASKELELTCWDLVLTCIDKLIRIFFGFEEKDKPLVKANREVKRHCGMSRIFGVVEATAYKRKSGEPVLSKEDTSKRMCLGMFKPIEDKVTGKTKSPTTDANGPIEDSPPNETHKPKRTESPIVEEAQFDQKSTYSKLNDDENVGKMQILDKFLKSTQVYPTEEDINESGETIQESNLLLENQIKDPIKGTNTTMSVSINVKQKRLKNKKKSVKTSRKPPNGKKSILKNPSVYDDDFGHNVTSKGVQTGMSLLFEGYRGIHELKDSFQDFSLDSNCNKDDFTVVRNPNDGKYIFVKKSAYEDNEVCMLPFNIDPSKLDNFFKFKKPLETPLMFLPAINDGNYLQGMQFEPEEDNYEKYKKQIEPPLRLKPIKNVRAEEGNFRGTQFEQTDGNYDKFKKPTKSLPISNPIINSRAEEGSYLFQHGKINKPFERPLRSKPIPNSRTEEGSNLPFRGMQLQQEEDSYENFAKPSEPPDISLRYKPLINSRAERGSNFPSHGMQFQHEENKEKFKKRLEHPLRSKPILNSRAEEPSHLPFRSMQFRQEEDEKFKKPFELPLRSKPNLNSRTEEGLYLQSMQFQQEENNYNTYKKRSEPPRISKDNLNRLNEGNCFPFQGMQFEQEDNYERLKKPYDPPQISEPMVNRVHEGKCFPFQGMTIEQKANNYETFKKPQALCEQENQRNYLGLPEMRRFELQENNYETLEPPLMRRENRINEGNYLPFSGMQQFAQEKDKYEKFKNHLEPPLRSMINNGDCLPSRCMTLAPEKDGITNFKKPLEPQLTSKPMASEDNYVPFQCIHREDINGKFKNPLKPPLISKPMINRVNEGGYLPFEEIQLFEQEDETFQNPMEPPLKSNPSENRVINGGSYLAYPGMHHCEQIDGRFKKTSRPTLVLKQRLNNLNEGGYLPFQEMQQFGQEDETLQKTMELPLKSNPSENRVNGDNNLPYPGMHHCEQNDGRFKKTSEPPLISKPINRVNEGGYLPFREMQQFEQENETFQKPREPPFRSIASENRVHDGIYLAFPGMRHCEQNDGRCKKPSEPPLWSKSAGKKTRENRYMPFPGMHQIEQYENLEKPVQPSLNKGKENNYLLFRGMQFEQEDITEKFKKSSEPPPRLNRMNEGNYLPYSEMPAPEKARYKKCRNPGEGYYFPSQNMQFEQSKNTYEQFQKPVERPPMMNRIKESRYLPFHQCQQKQNYINYFKNCSHPPPIENGANDVNHLPFLGMQQDERFTKPSKLALRSRPMINKVNECNCLPLRGMQFEQKDDFENLKKVSEPPFISKQMMNRREDDYLPFQDIQFEQKAGKIKNSDARIMSKPISNRLKENNYLSFRGIKKLPFQTPVENRDISSQSPYFSKKNYEPKYMKTQDSCSDSTTKSSYFNEMPQENCHTVNNKFHNFRPETLRNHENVIVSDALYGSYPQGQFIVPQVQENVNPNRCHHPEENWNQIIEAPPEIVPDEALEEPPWLTPNVSNDDFYMERSPKADHNKKFHFNCSPNIFSSETQTQKEFKSVCNLKDFGNSNSNLHKKQDPKKSDKMFDFKPARSPNIFSSEPQTQNDLKSFCDLQEFGLTGSKMASSNLEISIPNKDGQMDVVQKDLCDLRENNFDLGSMESNLLIMEETEKSLEKSRVIVDSQNEWLREVNNNGKKFFFNKRTGMVTVQTPKISQTKFDFDERLDFVPKGLSPALKGHAKVEQLLSQRAKNKLQDLILEGYEDELMVIKWQKFIGNSPKTFFENIYKEKTKQFEAQIPSVHENALKIPKDFVNFNKKMFKSLTVLGQLDKKFIVVYETTKDLLILFDQHAVHERIRVERLAKEYKGMKMPYKGQWTFFLQHNDLSLLKNNVEYLESLGLGVDFMTNGLQIRDIPLCIQEKVNNGNEVNIEDLNKILNFLIKDTVEFLKFSRGSAGTMMPKILQNIINLKACRGAIKFGNSLTETECSSLLKELSKCMLPFQCAHGRPTLSPIVSLGKINVRIQDKKPNLKKLLSV